MGAGVGATVVVVVVDVVVVTGSVGSTPEQGSRNNVMSSIAISPRYPAPTVPRKVKDMASASMPTSSTNHSSSAKQKQTKRKWLNSS